MTERLSTRWRAFVVIASLVLTLAIFQFAGRAVAPFAALVGVVPIAVAAWLFGARAAIGIAIVEGIANLRLLGSNEASAEQLTLQIVEGAALALVAITAGVAQGAKRRLAAALSTDEATGLPNRQAYLRHVDGLDPRTTDVTIGMLELVDLGEIDEAFGYDTGEQVLRVVTVRLRDAFGPTAFLAKVRDRFTVVWPSMPDLDDSAIASSLLAVVDAPFPIRGAQIRPRGRASVSRRSVTGAKNGTELFRAGSRALEGAATDGRAWGSATATDPTDGVSRLQLLGDLGNAITRGELRLHYQPIVDLTTGMLQGFEALVRWQHPGRGLVPPLDFIPLAERSGLIVPLTEWVIDEALRQSRAWSDDGRHIRVSVNVGAKALVRSAGLESAIERLLAKHGVEASQLCVEVTESDLMTDPAHAADILGRLRTLGIHIEMDDFGTGYSSLAYLQKLPVNSVKIDRSLIAPLLRDENTAAIVRAAIDLSHGLGLDTIAEGVEDPEALQRLKDMGCDAAQGYLIARPMRGAEVLGWIHTFERAPVTPRVPRPVTAEPVIAVAGGSLGTVLVVDDEHPFRLAAHRVLTAQGYRVLHAATASEALRICSELDGKISLLLTDIFLSDWRGNDLAAHLRRSYPDLRIMYMSGDAQGRERAGTDAFLAKPFSNRDLVEHVAGALAS
ncbi:MAG TPA: EAL domain-containing protein [Candidatus Limnocylindria bacterium]